MRTGLVYLAVWFSMSHIVGVRDSRTIVAEMNGVMSTVTLKDVVVAPDEEAQAADYLRRMLANAWVFIDKGDVYRSPDALFINGDMNRHPWRTMRYLGELDLGARAKGQPPGVAVKDPTLPATKTTTPKRISVTSKPKKK
jgi:hypothetical protein